MNTFLEPLMKLLKSVSEWQSPRYSSLPTVFVAILKDEGRGNPPKYSFINSLWLSRCCERTFLESCNEVVPEKMRRMPVCPISSHLRTLRPKCRMMMMMIKVMTMLTLLMTMNMHFCYVLHIVCTSMKGKAMEWLCWLIYLKGGWMWGRARLTWFQRELRIAKQILSRFSSFNKFFFFALWVSLLQTTHCHCWLANSLK